MADRPRAAPGSTRTIDVGVGVDLRRLRRGRGLGGNFVDGTVSRVDPRDEPRHGTGAGRRRPGAGGRRGRRPGSAPRAGPAAGRCPARACGELGRSGGRQPDVLIASDLPLQGPSGVVTRAMVDAIRFVLREHGFRAGSFTVGYRSCDDSTAQTGDFETRALRRERQRVRARQTGSSRVIGPFNSFCAADRDPDPQPRPGRAAGDDQPDAPPYAGLTRGGELPPPRTATAASPTSTTRPACATSCACAAATTCRARRSPCSPSSSGSRASTSLDDGSGLLEGPAHRPVRSAARTGSASVAGSASFDPTATEPRGARRQGRALAARDGVVLGADPFDGGDRLREGAARPAGAARHAHGRLRLRLRHPTC